jgi:outer membrane murein-binding lipoprotein Lpp
VAIWLFRDKRAGTDISLPRNNQISLAKSDLIIELRKKDLIQNATALNKLEAKASRTPEEAAQVAQLKIDRTVLMEDLKAANARYNTAMEYLSSGGCENQ